MGYIGWKLSLFKIEIGVMFYFFLEVKLFSSQFLFFSFLFFIFFPPYWSLMPHYLKKSKGFVLKVPYSSKIDIFIQERFHKLIYGTNTIIKCGTWQPAKFQLHVVSRSWTGTKMKWFFLSYLWINTPKLIQWYDKNHFIFDWLKLYMLLNAQFMIVLIPYINLLDKKCLFWYWIWSL